MAAEAEDSKKLAKFLFYDIINKNRRLRNACTAQRFAPATW